jgi:hypothetical protein
MAVYRMGRSALPGIALGSMADLPVYQGAGQLCHGCTVQLRI